MRNRRELMKKTSSYLFALAASVFLMSCASAPEGEVRTQVTGTALPQKMQKVVAIAAYTANGDTENLKRAINEGLDSGLTVNEIGEVVLQLYAYAGFPRSLNGQAALTAVLEERQAEGKRDAVGTEPDFLPEGTDKYALGVSHLGTLMGFPLQQQKGDTNGYANGMDAFLKEHLFADIFGRDNVSFTLRELSTISALAAMEGTNSQQMFHMSAAMNTGLTEEQMFNFVEVIGAELGAERGANAEAVLTQVLARRNGSGGAPAGGDGGYSYIPEVFPRGELSGNTTIFTGNSYVAPLVPFNSGSVPIVNVTFEPGARTTWHAHSYIQVLLVTMGQGYYQEEGKEPQKLKAGDTVFIPAGVKHWHGSAPGEWFAHIAVIVPVENGPEDQWLDPVADDEYGRLE